MQDRVHGFKVQLTISLLSSLNQVQMAIKQLLLMLERNLGVLWAAVCVYSFAKRFPP